MKSSTILLSAFAFGLCFTEGFATDLAAKISTMTPPADYCAFENEAQCSTKTFWEGSAQCPDGMKAVAVSCSISNFSYSPKLVENGPASKDPTRGICVWRLAGGHKPHSDTTATTVVLCGVDLSSTPPKNPVN